MSLVYLHNKQNGVTYVYESTGHWDKVKKQARNDRTCIGKLDAITGEIIYSKKYKEQDEILPAKRGPSPSLEYKRSFYGATYLFDAIGDSLGITEDLKKCFPESYDQILSIAYYLILEDRNPMSRFRKWALTHAHPYGKDIPSQRSSEIFGEISENSKQLFFQLQAKRRLEEEFLAFDTTSISSYSKSLKQVKYGINKDHDKLPQINLALIFGEASRLPALIFLSYIKKAMSDKDLFKNYTMQELLDELDIIERFDLPGRKHHVGEMTKKQQKLYECLGFNIPS